MFFINNTSLCGGSRLLYRMFKKIFVVLLIGFLVIQLLTSSWFWRKLYPFPHRELVTKNCLTYQVDPFLVLAIMKTESRFYTTAHSRAGAKGLMQIMPETGSWIAGRMKLEDYDEDKLFAPSYNIPMGIWYVAYLDKVFNGDTVKVLAAYNAGERKVKRWLEQGKWTGKAQDIEQIPYKETRAYVGRVLFSYRIYQRLY